MERRPPMRRERKQPDYVEHGTVAATAYSLRRHLSAGHRVAASGCDFAELVDLHRELHAASQAHPKAVPMTYPDDLGPSTEGAA